MRRKLIGVLSLVTVAGLAVSAAAQEPQVRQMRVMPPGSTQQQARPPYTAEFKTTRVQTLADGSTITHVTTETMARDSQGRTLNMSSSNYGPDDQPVHISVNIYDLAAHTHTWWFVPGQRITTQNIPEPGSGRPSCAANALAALPHAPLDQHAKPMMEDLGKQTFQGLEAHGHRTTTAYPAGAIGNSDPLVRTDEVWFSTTPGFSGINVRQVNEDPQMGKTTRELVSFSQGEPDASMFQPPADYEVATQETHDEVRCP
jgi:hypothetical protein